VSGTRLCITSFSVWLSLPSWKRACGMLSILGEELAGMRLTSIVP